MYIISYIIQDIILEEYIKFFLNIIGVICWFLLNNMINLIKNIILFFIKFIILFTLIISLYYLLKNNGFFYISNFLSIVWNFVNFHLSEIIRTYVDPITNIYCYLFGGFFDADITLNYYLSLETKYNDLRYLARDEIRAYLDPREILDGYIKSFYSYVRLEDYLVHSIKQGIE
jgi:hypothetical protein